MTTCALLKLKKRTPILVALLSMIAIVASGCLNVGASGDEGNMTFCEDDNTADITGIGSNLSSPIAQFAQRDIYVVLGTSGVRACSSRSPAQLVDAYSSDTEIFDVIEVSDNVVIIEALNEGRAKLHVESVSGLLDSYEFEVKTPAKTEIELLSNAHFAKMAEGRVLTDNDRSDDLIALPGSTIELLVQRYSENNKLLSGYGGVQWDIEGDVESVELLVEDDSARAGITLNDDAQPGQFQVNTDHDISIAVEIVAPEELSSTIATMALLQSGLSKQEILFEGDIIRSPRGDIIFELAAYDDDGRAVHGTADTEVEVNIIAGHTELLGDETSHTLTFQNDGRRFILPVKDRGEARLEFLWLEQRLELGIVIE